MTWLLHISFLKFFKCSILIFQLSQFLSLFSEVCKLPLASLILHMPQRFFKSFSSPMLQGTMLKCHQVLLMCQRFFEIYTCSVIHILFILGF